jgi:hypothetical protein
VDYKVEQNWVMHPKTIKFNQYYVTLSSCPQLTIPFTLTVKMGAQVVHLCLGLASSSKSVASCINSSPQIHETGISPSLYT